MDADSQAIDLLQIMETALGDSPSFLPTGCGQLLTGCLARLPSEWLEIAAFRPHVRRLFIKIMRCLAKWSSARSDDMEVIYDRLRNCQCAHPDHLALHMDLIPNAHPTMIIDQLMEDISEILRFRFAHHLRISGVSTKRLPSSDDRARWPADIGELLPSPHELTFESLISWPRPSYNFWKLVAAIVKSVGPSLALPLLRGPPAREWLTYISENKGQWIVDKTTIQGYRIYCSQLGSINDLIICVDEILFDAELRYWFMTGHTGEELERKASATASWFQLFVELYASRNDPVVQSDKADADRLFTSIERQVLSVAGRVLHVLGQSENCTRYTTDQSSGRQDTDGVEEVHQLMKKAAVSWNHIWGSPFFRLLYAGYGHPWEGRCHGPSCVSGRLRNGGHNFAVCKACHHAAYCSRRCQKQAWRLPGGAHRELCGVSRIIHEMILARKGTPLIRLYHEVGQRISVEAAEAAYANIQTLIQHKTDYLFKHLSVSKDN